MAIGFARQEFVQRSKGRNAIQKSSYISRTKMEFEGNCALDPKRYDFSYHKEPAYHSVFLPDHVDERFKDPQVLWSLAEQAETRKNSVVQTDNLIALPDEEEVTLEMKVQIVKAIAKEAFTDHGLGVQVAIHFPTKQAKGEAISGTIIELSNGSFGFQKEGTGRVVPITQEELEKYDISASNWHAHLLGTTRRFTPNGQELGEKARDVMPQIRHNRIVSGCNLMPQSVEITNRILKENGLALRVELSSLMPQTHLGPVRMRGECTELMAVHKERQQLNTELAKNPENILIAISEKQSIFTKEDVERYISKHTPESHIEHVRGHFWQLPDLIQLRDKQTHKPLALFSCRETIEEERKIMRIAQRIDKVDHSGIRESVAEKFSQGLNHEQKEAYSIILDGRGLSVLHGYAGTGKSYVLKALDSAYRAAGVTVRALGADNGAAEALRDKGIVDVQNIHQFLFKVNRYDKLVPGKREVWILDEAGKLGNEILLEFLKTAQKYQAKVVVSGDPAQLAAIQRGGMFKVLSEQFESSKLVEIQRQQEQEGIEIVKQLAKGNTDFALERLTSRGALKWSETKREAIEALVTDWAKANKPDKGECPSAEKSIMIAGTNAETRILNSLVRETRKAWGVIGDENVECRTGFGTFQVSANDLIHFRGNDKKIGVLNGMRGTVISAKADALSVAIQGSGKETRLVTFNPKAYNRFHLGYATNTDLSQGGTWRDSYILDSPRTTKEMLYVNLSRHIESCNYYVAKTEAICLSELKFRARRSGEKFNTFEHTHTAEIETAKGQAAREQALSELKRGDRFKTKFKGHVLSIADAVKGKIQERSLDRGDLKQKAEVYDYKNRQIFKTEPVVNVPNVSGKLAELGTPKPFLAEKLLKKIDVDHVYQRFFEVSTKASNLRLVVANEAKQQGVPEEGVEAFKEMIGAYQEKYALGKIFVEGANYQKLSISEEWGSDVEKAFKKAEEKFVDAFTPKDLFLKHEKTALSKAWEKNYFESRRILKYSQAEAFIQETREEDKKAFSSGRQLAFAGNWHAYASLLESEKKTTQDAIYGVATIGEDTEARLTDKGIVPLKHAVESFLNSTNRVYTLFKEGFVTQEKPLQAAEASYRHCLNAIGVLRREIAAEAAEHGRADFSECPSYKLLLKEFGKREELAIGCLAQLESRYLLKEETFEERVVSQLNYQTARFEKRFQLSDLRNEESKTEFSNETTQAVKEYEEVSILTLQLKRSCTIEAMAQGKALEQAEDFELYGEACDARREVASDLLRAIEKAGNEHFSEAGKTEVCRATMGAEKQQAIASVEQKEPMGIGAMEGREQEEAKEQAVRGDYSHWYKEVGRLGRVVEQEKAGSGGNPRSCPHFKDFQQACVSRNKAACQARDFFGADLEASVGEKAARFIQLQASKHEEIERDRQEKEFAADSRVFGAFLSQHTEQLVEKLFPEGAKTSSAKEWRFGEKGSLSVKRDGYYFDYETHEGGGILKLIQKEIGTDSKGAVSWVKDTLGGFPTATTMKQKEKQNPIPTPAKEDQWVTLRPDPDVPEPSRRASQDGFVEVSRHAYKDAEGHLLYYSVRMEDRNGNKRVVPLSFGHRKGEEQETFWRMKGYHFGAEKRTLYNLHLLKEHPQAPVVIVEGEKTADAASATFEKIGRKDWIGVSWSGGARAVSKTDWGPLAGREKVLIWADNDEAGKSAGKMLEKELIGVSLQKQEIHKVDEDWLERKFPKGWDLADPFPKGLGREELRDRSRGYNIAKISDRFEYLSNGRTNSFGERSAMADISQAFLDGRREALDAKLFALRSGMQQDRFLLEQAEEVEAIYKKEAATAKKLGQDPQVNASGGLQKDLARQCTLFEARNGRAPNLSEVLLMRNAIEEVGKSLSSSAPNEAWACAKQRTLAGVCERSLKIGTVSTPPAEELQRQTEREMREIEKAQQREITLQRTLQREKDLERSMEMSF